MGTSPNLRDLGKKLQEERPFGLSDKGGVGIVQVYGTCQEEGRTQRKQAEIHSTHYFLKSGFTFQEDLDLK